MSTVKVNDLKLQLQQNQIPAVFAPESEPPLLRMANKSMLVAGNDWEVLVWAWKLNTVKIDQSVKSLIGYLASNPLEQTENQ